MADEPIYDFEKRADRSIENLPILRAPIRAVMAGLFGAVDALVNGSYRGAPTRQAEGEALISRLSYLYPSLARCPIEPIGTDAMDALEGFREADPIGSQSRELLSYAHLCELIPEVRKGYYRVDQRNGGFDLHHVSPEFAEAEVRDILLSELALAFMDVRPPSLWNEFDLLAGAAKLRGPDRRLGITASKLVPQVLSIQYEHAFKHIIEPPLLTDEGFAAAAGIAQEEFFRLRAALLAMAAFCSGMRASIRRRIERDGESEHLLREYNEWINVFWKEDYFYEMISQMSGMGRAELESAISFYTFDLRPGIADRDRSIAKASEGFTPPLMRLPGCVLFSPDVLLRFVTGRNIGYILNRIDRERFDDCVSHHLEPQLIASAVELLKDVPGLEIIEDVLWEKGQIDLLIYIPSRNIALHIQAKGAIPPQGARMTRAIETRVEEAFDQLKRFRKLNSTEQSQILSNAVKHPVIEATIVDVVLLRSCAGTEKIWSKRGESCILTLPILSAIARKAEVEERPDPIADCKAQSDNYISDLIRAANPRWERGSITVDGVEVTMPLLKLNQDILTARRIQAWQGRSVGRATGNPWKTLRRAPDDPVIVRAQERMDQKRKHDEALVARVKTLILAHPDWEAKQIGKAVGLHYDRLLAHPEIGPLLYAHSRNRVKKKRR